ncbi:Cytoplasmic tRNA 2-thiolation protein 2 [Polyrhizophydium stewartii]|uniref:Cytoplasmic tRNA 2-thiolation protein 2 n=1 Tax=Polyrhizophydium stewartii TaxID=2732419 RepID=A0ABR4N962_9FUNG
MQCDPDPAPQPARREPTGRLLKPGLCNKCKAEKPVVVVKRAEFCRACFLSSVSHRFRANLSKTPLSEGSRTMLAFSGGPSSRAMLHAMADFAAPDAANPRKKIRFPDFCVCHVDQSAVLGNADSLPAVLRIAESYGRPVSVVPLESALDGAPLAAVDAASVAPLAAARSLAIRSLEDAQIDRRAALRHMFDGLGSASSREDMLRLMTLHVLLAEARRQKCTGLLLADNATLLAVRVIANTSKGRGLSLPADIGDTDWYPGKCLAAIVFSFII